MPYSCTLSGQCEEDIDDYEENGQYEDLATCQTNCKPYPLDIPLDILYEILSFNLEEALDLAPSDVRVILFRVTGIRVPSSSARIVLSYVIDKNYVALWNYSDDENHTPSEVIRDYVRSQLTDQLDLFLIDVLSNGYYADIAQPDWASLRRKTIRFITHLFQEKSSSHTVDQILEGLERHGENLDKLIYLLKYAISSEVLETIYPANTRYYTPWESEKFISHWAYIVEQFGPKIPYQKLLTDREEEEEEEEEEEDNE